MGVLALTANDVVDILRVERGVGIDGREVAAPDDLNLRVQAADLFRCLHRGDHLRTGHDGDADHLNVVLRDEVEDDFNWIVVEIAVDDLIFFAALKHGRDGQDRERKTAIAWSGSSWIEEDDHFMALTL